MMLISFACPVIFAIPSATGFMAKSQGKSFWLWFGLAFLLPVVSTVYLWTQLDKNPKTESSAE